MPILGLERYRVHDERKRQAAGSGKRGEQPLDEEPAHLGGYSCSAGAVRHLVRHTDRAAYGQCGALFDLPRQGADRRREGSQYHAGNRRNRLHHERGQVPHQQPGRPETGRDAASEGRGNQCPTGGYALDLAVYPRPVAAVPAVPRHCLLRAAPDAEEFGLRRDGLRQEPRPPADAEGRQGHLRRRRGYRRGARGAAGDRRVPQGPVEVRAPRRQDPQGRAAGRLAGYRQDAARPRDRG